MPTSNRSVLITGGAGFIGSALSAGLVANGSDVTVLDILHPQVHAGRGIDRLPPEATFFPVDVTQPVSWDAVLSLRSPDVVVHLAAETGTGQSLRESSRHGQVNVVGTTQMLDALLRNDCVPEHIVLASSRAVYGEGLWARTNGGGTYAPGPRRHADLVAQRWDPTDETGAAGRPEAHRAGHTPERPSNVYGATKLAQEHILRAWTAATGTALSTLRLQNVFGPGQSPTNVYTGIVVLFATLASGGQVLEVYEDGNIVRDFVHIDDVTSALLATIARPPSAARTLDVGSGVPTTIAELAGVVADRFEAPVPVVSGRFRDGDVRAAFADIGPAGEEIGYQPVWSLEKGLDSLISWLSEADR